MTRGQIVTLLTSRHEAFERRDLRKLAGLYSEECVLESPMAGTVAGRAAIEQAFHALFTAFPDLVFTSDEILIDGDRVAQTLTLVGTDIGGFMGLPPTAKRFRTPVVVLSTIKDEHIVAERRIYDFTGLLMQVGVLKARPV
jgi:steroid delta-isomerase-like uncharacterized protein